MTNSILPLKMDSVTVRKRGKIILDEISLNFSPTGLTTVMGPNGAGKTTLLRSLHGLERLASGSISWDVEEQQTRNRQAFVFQTPIVMRRTVKQNIAFPLLVRGMAKSEALKQAEDCAASVGLGDRLNLNATFLSGGERQKLALGRALIGEPEILFLDEPTTNLDGASTREIETILLNAHQNGTRIIMTTHDLGQAKRLSTDVVFLNRGKLCEASSSKSFFKKPESKAAQAYLKGEIVE